MAKYRVLLVDDEPEIRECLEMLSPGADMVFDQAADGEAGLKMILAQKYDCVVSDIKMPRMSGIEMLKKVREAGSDVPMVFVSAFASDDFAHQVGDYGAVKLLHKLDILKVHERIHEAIELGNEIRALHAQKNPIAEDFIQLVHRTGSGK